MFVYAFYNLFFFFFKETVWFCYWVHLLDLYLNLSGWICSISLFFHRNAPRLCVCTHYMASLDPENSEFHVDLFATHSLCNDLYSTPDC